MTIKVTITNSENETNQERLNVFTNQTINPYSAEPTCVASAILLSGETKEFTVYKGQFLTVTQG